MGISVLVPEDVGVLKMIVQWGDYAFEGDEESKEGESETEVSLGFYRHLSDQRATRQA